MKPIILSLLLLTSCTFTLDPISKKVATTPAENAHQDQCESIDREHSIATLGASITGALAGAGGLSSIPIEDERVQRGLVTGASIFGIGALVFGILAQERAERYSKKCARP